MGFDAFAKIGTALADEGKYHYAYVVKTATPVPGTAGVFVDMNQTSGQPIYNPFASSQALFTALEGVGNRGLYAGNFLTGSTKHLVRWQVLNPNTTANTTSPDYVYLCDYLGYYPLIDGDSLDQQVLDNTASLTRYTDGEGVRIVIIAQAPMATPADLTITYTNSDGISGRTVTHTVIAATSIGVAVSGTGTGGTASPTPFVPLASGDKGVRSIQSVQFLAASGGFICLALVKPLAQIQTYEANVPVEKNYGFDNQMLPEIKQGAYLNFLIMRSGTAAGQLRSELLFANS